MAANFDLYLPGASWLHRLDPRVKLLLVVEGTVFLFLWPQVAAAAATLLAVHVLLRSARVPWSRIGALWRLVLPLTLLIPALWLIFQPGPEPPLWAWGPLRLTMSALERGVAVALRLDALAFLMFLWLFTTSQAELVRGLAALGMPYTWSLTLSLALRYLPTVAGLYQQVVDAQRARGLDLDHGPLRRRLQAYQPILVAVLISALRLSQGLAWSLEARGLGASTARRSTYRPLHFTARDWAATASLLILFLLAVAARALIR
jgi:energy-coupling factor transport system permease protein